MASSVFLVSAEAADSTPSTAAFSRSILSALDSTIIAIEYAILEVSPSLQKAKAILQGLKIKHVVNLLTSTLLRLPEDLYRALAYCLIEGVRGYSRFR